MSQNSSSDRAVIVIGAAGLDMIGRLKDPIRPGSTNPANIRVSYGGVGRNVAENLARLGQPVQLITAVGQDRMGNEMLAHTAACGVEVSACLQCGSSGTGSYLAVLDENGQRVLAMEDMQVLLDLKPDMIEAQREMFTDAAMLFMDANPAPEILETALKIAREAHVPVGMDATSILLAGRLLPYLPDLYMITANSAEASLLCQNELTVTDQDTALTAARRLVNQGVELAIITLAEFGVVYATSETSGHIPAMSTHVLDPTGAGDALVATVIFGLMNDISIDESVRLGVTAASLVLRHRGTIFPGLSLEKLYDELVV